MTTLTPSGHFCKKSWTFGTDDGVANTFLNCSSQKSHFAFRGPASGCAGSHSSIDLTSDDDLSSDSTSSPKNGSRIERNVKGVPGLHVVYNCFSEEIEERLFKLSNDIAINPKQPNERKGKSMTLTHDPEMSSNTNSFPAVALPLLSKAKIPTGGYANGFVEIAKDFNKIGATVDLLKTRTDLNPETYADIANNWVKSGATYIGGCCEVGPAHIAELKRRFG